MPPNPIESGWLHDESLFAEMGMRGLSEVAESIKHNGQATRNSVGFVKGSVPTDFHSVKSSEFRSFIAFNNGKDLSELDRQP